MAPIPGRVASVLVQPGDAVQRGQVLVVVEAMKMEITLAAPEDGIVSAVRCAAGDMVEEGVELVHFEPPAAP
jgi:3-methylcrotonyl-CoA carboxylase alpha subunit